MDISLSGSLIFKEQIKHQKFLIVISSALYVRENTFHLSNRSGLWENTNTSAVSPRRTNTVWYHSYGESKKQYKQI